MWWPCAGHMKSIARCDSGRKYLIIFFFSSQQSHQDVQSILCHSNMFATIRNSTTTATTTCTEHEHYESHLWWQTNIKAGAGWVDGNEWMTNGKEKRSSNGNVKRFSNSQDLHVTERGKEGKQCRWKKACVVRRHFWTTAAWCFYSYSVLCVVPSFNGHECARPTAKSILTKVLYNEITRIADPIQIFSLFRLTSLFIFYYIFIFFSSAASVFLSLGVVTIFFFFFFVDGSGTCAKYACGLWLPPLFI